MAVLTQIGTDGIKNDAITAGKIAAGAVDADITTLPDNSVSLLKMADNAVGANELILNNQNYTFTGTTTIVAPKIRATALQETVVTLTPGNSSPDTVVVDLSAGNVFRITATQAITRFNFTNAPAGVAMGFTMRIKRNNNSSFAIDFENDNTQTIKFAGGSAPDIMAHNEEDIYTFYKDDESDTVFYGALAADAIASIP
tara:strand:- start:43 stop:639 length:597 start_codon:yes stop_codon:yes gene_type:complete